MSVIASRSRMAVRHGTSHQIGRARDFERGAVGVGRGVEVEQIDAGRQRPIQVRDAGDSPGPQGRWGVPPHVGRPKARRWPGGRSR